MPGLMDMAEFLLPAERTSLGGDVSSFLSGIGGGGEGGKTTFPLLRN